MSHWSSKRNKYYAQISFNPARKKFFLCFSFSEKLVTSKWSKKKRMSSYFTHRIKHSTVYIKWDDTKIFCHCYFFVNLLIMKLVVAGKSFFRNSKKKISRSFSFICCCFSICCRSISWESLFKVLILYAFNIFSYEILIVTLGYYQPYSSGYGGYRGGYGYSGYAGLTNPIYPPIASPLSTSIYSSPYG